MLETMPPPDFPGAVMIDEQEIESVVEVLKAKSPFRYYGPNMMWKAKTFEEKFAMFIGVKHCLAVSSGTAALVVGLRALGIGPGDEVVVPANTFIASAGAVLECGAVPVFCEIDESFTIDVSKIEERITSRTRAIMPVHFGGAPCNMGSIMRIAETYRLFVIEDCAQACGAAFDGKRVGSFGHVGAFSFQINKIITTGDGGAVVTNSDELYLRAVRAHDHGCLRNEDGRLSLEESSEAFFSTNYRMNELTAAVGLAQLSKVENIIKKMKFNKISIIESLTSMRNFKVSRIWDKEGDTGRNLMLIANTRDRAALLVGKLKRHGFSASVPYGGYPVYFHKQIKDLRMWKKYAKMGKSIVDSCPFTEKLLPRSVMIGVSPLFTREHIDLLVNVIRRCDRA